MTARATIPTEKNIRGALIARMESYCERLGIAPSTVCLAVMNDTSFFAKVKGGSNFTVGSYQRIIDFMAAHPDGPAPHPKKKKKKNGSA
jgi:hypothetical protein